MRKGPAVMPGPSIMERTTGIETATYTLARCRTSAKRCKQHRQLRYVRPEPTPIPGQAKGPGITARPLDHGADDRDRTGDLHLGKVSRYQLRYVRIHRVAP